MNYELFELKEEHITLLQNAYLRWEDCETGAPAIDCKRPYGNSYVPADVAEILEYDVDDEEVYDNDALNEELMQWHYETETALQIILATKSFVPGTYEKYEEYNSRAWRLVE